MTLQDSTYDFSKSDDIVAFLRNTPFQCSNAERLTGGTANYAFRLFLVRPFEGQETLVLKHAKPFYTRAQSISLSVDRQKFEVESLRFVKQILDADGLVTVPTVYHFYEKENAIIMEDCGADARDMKQLMLNDPLTLEEAKIVGEELGKFLAIVHEKGSQNQELMNICAKNEEAKRVSAWATYGRLVDTLEDQGTSKGLIVPPLQISKQDVDKIAKIADRTGKAVVSAEKEFTMGDFWTGNIVIKRKRNAAGERTVNRVFVIDWELAKTGLQYLDVGQLLAELHLLELFHTEKKEAVNAAIDAFTEAYAKAKVIDTNFARGAAVHVGAHLIAWTPRVGWGTKERTREVVEEGVEYITRSDEEGWLRNSVASGLLT